jgi:hypothetical protein
MFCNFYLVKNHKISNSSTIYEANEIKKIIKFYLRKFTTDFKDTQAFYWVKHLH